MKDWLLQFWQKVIKLLPRYVIVKKGQRAVLLFCGKPRKTVGPGIYFLMPIFDDCDVISVVCQSIDLENTPATTRDDKSVQVSAVVVYHVSDIVKALYAVYDYDQFIRNAAETSLVRVFDQTNWAGRDQDEIERFVSGGLVEEGKTCGVAIDSVKLNGLAKARNYYITHRLSTASRAGSYAAAMAGEEE